MFSLTGLKWSGIFIILLHVQVVAAQQRKHKSQKPVTIYEHLKHITTDPLWSFTDSIPLNFKTYHTQGMTKAGAYFYLSAVKVKRWPKKFEKPVDGFDRDQGEGIGYLFKFGNDGKLVDSIQLGNNEIYHPGGIDFDGKYIWVPVCEYRPFGKSVIYRINPETLAIQAITTIPDAIGAVAYNRETNELVGMNWGSRILYRWKIEQSANKVKAVLQHVKGEVNPHFYVDFQDCNYVGNGKMFCSGLRSYKNQKGEIFKLGGLELIDMRSYEATLQFPVNVYTPKGIIITNNPFYVGVANNKLQFYFIPEDDKSVLYIYQANKSDALH